MRELIPTYLKVLSSAWTVFFFMFMPTASAIAAQPVIKAVHVMDNPFSVTVDMTGKAPVKVVRVGDHEILVAIKNAQLTKGTVIDGKNNPNLESIHVEALDGNVIALMVTSKHPSEETIKFSFDADNQLTVVLNKTAHLAAAVPQSPPAPEPAPPTQTAPEPLTPAVSNSPKPEKQVTAHAQEPGETPPPAETTAGQAIQKAQPPTPAPKKETGLAKIKQERKQAPIYIPPKRQASRFKGDISDMYRGEDPLQGCGANAVENAMLLVKKQLYKEAGAILEQYLF